MTEIREAAGIRHEFGVEVTEELPGRPAARA